MGKEQTEKSRYPSYYGAGFITAAQYIVEVLCTMVAARDKMTLGNQFWKTDKWAKFFRGQVPAAKTLLKKYDEKIILAALKDKRLYGLNSLRAKWILSILEEYKNKKSDAIRPHVGQVIRLDNLNLPTFRLNQDSKKGILDILEDLDE